LQGFGFFSGGGDAFDVIHEKLLLYQWFKKISKDCVETQAGCMNSTVSGRCKSVNGFFGQFALLYRHVI